MPQGIIKFIAPQMQNGAQRSWLNKFTGRVNFGFNIVFEDGTVGNCGSEKAVYPIAAGTPVTYEINLMPNGSNHVTKIKRLEENGSGMNGSNGKTYNDPVVVKRIAFSMCQTIARMHYNNAGIAPRTLEEVNTLAKVYHGWVVSNIQENDPHFRDIISRRYYALQLAVDCIPFTTLGISKKEQVIASAETFLRPLKEIDHATRV